MNEQEMQIRLDLEKALQNLVEARNLITRASNLTKKDYPYFYLVTTAKLQGVIDLVYVEVHSEVKH